MITSVSRKRSPQKGIDAIFSGPKEERDARFVVGVAGILVGAALWTFIILDSEAPRLFGSSIISAYLSLSLASIGLLFTICGSGICLAFSVVPRRSATDRMGAGDTIDYPPSKASSDHESRAARIGQNDQSKETHRLMTTNLKLGLISFVQSCTLLVLYGGLVDEYRSNRTMQLWIRSTIPIANYALNWEAVILGSFILGLLTTQFLPRRIFAE